MVVGCIEDAISVHRAKDIDRPNEEESGAKVDQQSDRNISKTVSPAADPCENSSILHRRDHKRLIVHAACSRIDRGDLAQRSGNAHHDQIYGYPAPDDVGRSTSI